MLFEYSFYDYLFHSGKGIWWAPIKNNNYQDTNLRVDIKEAVRKVVNEGVRTLPVYIDEHDCISCGDILSISNNGVSADRKNRSNYIKDLTHVHTRYQSTDGYWVFYSFPAPKSDPFGYKVRTKDYYDSLNR